MSAAESFPQPEPISIKSLEPRPLWVSWQQETDEKGRLTKVPYSPHSGRCAATDRPTDWGTFAQASAHAKLLPNPHGMCGVGLVLGTDMGNGQTLAGVDLDTCRNPETGSVEEWAAHVAWLMGSYYETSPSMTGMKVFFTFNTADLPRLRAEMGRDTKWGRQFKRAGGEHPPAIELFLGGKYFTTTGLICSEWFSEINHVPTETLTELIKTVGPNFVADGKPAAKAGTPLFPVGGDQSRSGIAFSIGRRVKSNGGTFEQMCEAIANDNQTADWFHEKGQTNNQRELRRIWAKTDVEVVGGGVSTTSTSWEMPVDFFDDTSATGTPQIALEHLPDALFLFVTDTAARMGVEAATVALAAIVACSSAMSEAWQIQPRVRDYTWVENARLWGAIVGPPSILKTPVIAACTKPVDRLDAEARKRHAEEMRRYKAALAAWKKAGKDAGDPEPGMPRLERYMVEGTTVEALSEVLRDDDEARQSAPLGKVLVRQDEMSEWLAGFDRYRSGGRGGGDRGAYLRLYNGGRYTVDRIGRGSFSIPSWSASIIGGIQPEPIQRIAREAADDGLLQRFIYCVPAAQGAGEDRVPDTNAVRRYEALFPALAALQPPLTQDGGFFHAQVVKMHADAHVHRAAIERLITAIAALPGQSGRLKAALGKWNGLFARLALTFHLIEIADARVREERTPHLTVLSEANAKRAAALMRDVLLPHLLRAEAVMFSTTQTGHARWIAGYILAKGQSRITKRDIVQDYVAIRAPEAKRELKEVMESLVSVGWLMAEEQRNPSKDPVAWSVNPNVHTVFAPRAEAERARRKAEQSHLAEVFRELREAKAARTKC